MADEKAVSDEKSVSGEKSAGNLPASDGVETDVPVQLSANAVEERHAVVRLCLYALDRARSVGVVERLVAGLAEIGVTALRPDGELFDPKRHEAGGTVPTGDPALDGVVAETEVIGFLDRGQLVRVPIVTVYTCRTVNRAGSGG